MRNVVTWDDCQVATLWSALLINSYNPRDSIYLDMDWSTVGKPSGHVSFLLKVLFRSCRLTQTVPLSRQL